MGKLMDEAKRLLRNLENAAHNQGVADQMRSERPHYRACAHAREHVTKARTELLAFFDSLEQRLYEAGEATEEANTRADVAETTFRKKVREVEQNIRKGFRVRYDLIAEQLARELVDVRLRDTSPGARERRDKAERQERGDLVLEMSSFWPSGDAVGIWCGDGDKPGEAHVLNLATGLVEFWGNAKFVTLVGAERLKEVMGEDYLTDDELRKGKEVQG